MPFIPSLYTISRLQLFLSAIARDSIVRVCSIGKELWIVGPDFNGEFETVNSREKLVDYLIANYENRDDQNSDFESLLTVIVGTQFSKGESSLSDDFRTFVKNTINEQGGFFNILMRINRLQPIHRDSLNRYLDAIKIQPISSQIDVSSTCSEILNMGGLSSIEELAFRILSNRRDGLQELIDQQDLNIQFIVDLIVDARVADASMSDRYLMFDMLVHSIQRRFQDQVDGGAHYTILNTMIAQPISREEAIKSVIEYLIQSQELHVVCGDFLTNFQQGNDGILIWLCNNYTDEVSSIDSFLYNILLNSVLSFDSNLFFSIFMYLPEQARANQIKRGNYKLVNDLLIAYSHGRAQRVLVDRLLNIFDNDNEVHRNILERAGLDAGYRAILPQLDENLTAEQSSEQYFLYLRDNNLFERFLSRFTSLTSVQQSHLIERDDYFLLFSAAREGRISLLENFFRSANEESCLSALQAGNYFVFRSLVALTDSQVRGPTFTEAESLLTLLWSSARAEDRLNMLRAGNYEAFRYCLNTMTNRQMLVWLFEHCSEKEVLVNAVVNIAFYSYQDLDIVLENLSRDYDQYTVILRDIFQEACREGVRPQALRLLWSRFSTQAQVELLNSVLLYSPNLVGSLVELNFSQNVNPPLIMSFLLDSGPPYYIQHAIDLWHSSMLQAFQVHATREQQIQAFNIIVQRVIMDPGNVSQLNSIEFLRLFWLHSPAELRRDLLLGVVTNQPDENLIFEFIGNIVGNTPDYGGLCNQVRNALLYRMYVSQTGSNARLGAIDSQSRPSNIQQPQRTLFLDALSRDLQAGELRQLWNNVPPQEQSELLSTVLLQRFDVVRRLVELEFSQGTIPELMIAFLVGSGSPHIPQEQQCKRFLTIIDSGYTSMLDVFFSKSSPEQKIQAFVILMSDSINASRRNFLKSLWSDSEDENLRIDMIQNAIAITGNENLIFDRVRSISANNEQIDRIQRHLSEQMHGTQLQGNHRIQDSIQPQPGPSGLQQSSRNSQDLGSSSDSNPDSPYGYNGPPSKCSRREKRKVGVQLSCIDSLDEEQITKEEKERRVKELLGIESISGDSVSVTKAYGSKIVAVGSKRVNTAISNSKEYRTEVYVTVRDNNVDDKKLIVDDVEKMLRIENYVVVNSNDNYEIWLRDGDKHYIIIEKIEGKSNKYYLDIDGYKVKLDSIIKDHATHIEKQTIHDRLYQLSNDKELLENKKYIEDIGDIQDVGTNQGYNNIIEEIKHNFLAKGVREDTFDRFKSYFDDLSEKVFAGYISNVESSLKGKGIAFDSDKFDSAKIKGAKGGKFFSMMAIYDLLDSIGDTATLGRHNNDALNQVFGINGILDAMDDVRMSVSISPNSKVGKFVSKIPQHVRQTFVKIISNPVVQSITFATIAYQFGYSVNEIAKGNHHPLNYYWTASSGVKLASMSIRPISQGVSFTIKSVSTTTKVLRGLSAASKVLGRAAVVTMVADVLITTGVEIYERMEYTKAIAEQVPLLPGGEQAEVFFAGVIKFFTGRDVEKEYESTVRVKGYLNHIKEVATHLLDDHYNIAAVVQYVVSIEEKYSEIVKTVEERHTCLGKGLGCFDQWVCGLEKEYGSVSFDNSDVASNIRTDLSSLNISKTLPMQSHVLVMNEVWERFICAIKNDLRCYQGIDEKKVYIINTNAKHIPHLTRHEYEDLGLRIVNAPLGYSAKGPKCGSIINKQRIFRSYSVGERNMKCNSNKIYRDCREVFALSGEPFIFTNPTRKDPDNTKKQIFPRGSILYISGPGTLTAAANYPAVIYPAGYVSCVGSKNNETIFIINDHTSGTLEGGAGKENTLVINVKADNIIADLHKGMLSYGNGNNIRLVNTYNYVSNSDSKQSITTHCETRSINVKNAEVWQDSFNCTNKDYEVRVVNKENVHHRGLKQTIFIVNEDSDNARIVSDLGSIEKIKENIDIIRVQLANVTQWGISEDIEKVNYGLDLFANDMQSIVSSTKISDFKGLVIQVNSNGIIESVAIQDKSLSDTIKDIRYQKLKSSGSDISREIIQDSERKLKAFIQASILDQELINTYQVAKDIANNNNFDIPVSQVEVIKNHMGIPNEKVIIAGMYSDQVTIDFSYNDSDITSSYQKYLNSGKGYSYDDYVMLCSYYQDITIEGEKGQHQYIIKLPEYNNKFKRAILSFPIGLNLKIKSKVESYQSVPYNIIDFAELNVMDVNSIGIEEGKRSYINACYSKSISDLTEDSLEIKDIIILDSRGNKWSLSIGLVNYFQSPEHQQIVLQMNNELYKIDSTNLRLERVEMNPNSFRYYQPDEQGLQIYHNQPIDKNDIGLVDLKGKSILDFDMKVMKDNLLLSNENNTLVKVENWNTYQPAREMIFAFNDAIVSNSKCAASICNSEDIIVEFNKEKEQTQLDKELSGAVQDGDFNKVQGLVNRGANINAKDNRGNTLLHNASSSGNLGAVECLIGNGANINVKNNRGLIPLDAADLNNDIIKVLRQAHLDKDLLITVRGSDVEKIKDLIAKGIDGSEDRHGVYYFAWIGNLGVVKFIVENGGGVNVTDKYGCTLLHWTALKGHLEVATYLVNEKKGNVNAKDILGRTPMHFAVMNNHKDIQDVYVKGSTYTTAESEKVIQLFLMRGANINEADKNGETPLHLASWNGNLDAVKYLVGKGANIHAGDKDGRIPLDIARDKGYSNIVNYLEEELNKEREKPVQRRRRHHHGDHNSHHLSRKFRSIDSSNQPGIVASSSARPSSWINDCISWAKNLITRTFSIIPGLPAQYSIADKNNVKSDNKNIPQSTASVDWNNFLNNENIALARCVADALDDTSSKRYQNLISKGVEVVPNSKIAVEFALRKFDSFVEGKIRNLGSKEQARIHVELKDAYPEIIASLERGVEFSGNVGLDNVLEKCKKSLCTNVLPKDKVPTCLSEIGVTKLGGNLNR